MRSTWAVTISGIIVASLGAYAGTGFYIKAQKQAAFDAVEIGDTLDAVIEKFGAAHVRKGSGGGFSRYTASLCTLPCVETLWFENRLFFDTEAWSISIGSDDRVVEKNHWVSP